MAFIKRTWVDRISENPHRRKLTNTVSGEIITVDVEREEGTILQAGDAFSAANMNDLEDRIEANIGGLVKSQVDIPVADRNSGGLYFFY